MNVIPFVHEGLGNSSYLVQVSPSTCAVIDPDRSVDRYIHVAELRGWSIAAALETHLHADFVSGARELQSRTGAAVFASSLGELEIVHHGVDGGDRLRLDGAEVEVIASPGHTPEHVAFFIRRASGAPALFSGGSLLVGGAARTDLVSPAVTGELTRQQLHSVRRAFAGLRDETLLLPTHGGGSFCSAGATSQRQSTLGEERRQNPLLQRGSLEMSEEDFIATFPAAPDYFFRLREVNRSGPRLRSTITLPRLLEPVEFDRLRSSALVIDVRPQAAFMAAHIPGALSNSFRDAFATWLGWLVPPRRPLLFVLGDEPLERVLDECLLVGYEEFAGVLAGGMDAWERAGLPVAGAGLADATAARDLLLQGAVALDVREHGEFMAGHLPGAVHIPLATLSSAVAKLPRDTPLVVYCGHGERSATALSLLQAAGFSSLVNLDGGIEAWAAADFALAQQAQTHSAS